MDVLAWINKVKIILPDYLRKAWGLVSFRLKFRPHSESSKRSNGTPISC